jgi:hypothetical protein
VTVSEDGAIDEALAFGVITLDGAAVSGLHGTSFRLECRGACLSSVLPSVAK